MIPRESECFLFSHFNFVESMTAVKKKLRDPQASKVLCLDLGVAQALKSEMIHQVRKRSKKMAKPVLEEVRSVLPTTNLGQDQKLWKKA